MAFAQVCRKPLNKGSGSAHSWLRDRGQFMNPTGAMQGDPDAGQSSHPNLHNLASRERGVEPHGYDTDAASFDVLAKVNVGPRGLRNRLFGTHAQIGVNCRACIVRSGHFRIGAGTGPAAFGRQSAETAVSVLSQAVGSRPEDRGLVDAAEYPFSPVILQPAELLASARMRCLYHADGVDRFTNR